MPTPGGSRDWSHSHTGRGWPEACSSPMRGGRTSTGSCTGLVPNCGITVDSTRESRRGFTLAVPPITGTREGPRLFNTLPRDLRNLDYDLGTFKAHLDSYLETLPDQPAWSHDLATHIRDWGQTLWTNFYYNTWSIQPVDGQ